MDPSALFAIRARYLHIPEILIQAAVLDRVLEQLIAVHEGGVEGYTPENLESYTENDIHELAEC